MFKLFSKKEENTNDFAAVVSGKIIPLTAVNDDVFSKGMMGTGVAIVPDDDVIVAPCDGEVTMLFPTMHAFGMKNEDGVEILVHIGIDTVKLEGKGFEVLVENGQKVKKGDPMMRLDLSYLSENAPSLASPVLCTELEDNQKIRLLKEGEIKAGEPLFAVDFYE